MELIPAFTSKKLQPISHYVLDAMSFDEKSNNYKNSSIRKWLNDTFYNIAFSDNEKRIIEITEVDNGSLSTRYQNNHYACSNTNDKIFLLSRHEATLYGIINFSKIHGLEDFKKAQGTYFAEGQGLSSFRCYCCWWLRSPSCTSSEHAMMVDFDGGMDYELDIKSKDCGVRPAMWIKL